jgi:(+)-trans-carveol dehydrogenase
VREEANVGRVENKVAFITGAGRGQGRAHAVRLAEEGADIIAVDACKDIPGGCPYPLSSKSDLEETASLVRKIGRRIHTLVADVRNFDALKSAAQAGAAELGAIDIVCANAGIIGMANLWELTEEAWDDVIDVCLKGTWNTIRATLPAMLERGAGGSIILTSSSAAMVSVPGSAHYSAAKAGVISLCRVLANELHQQGSSIRVNCIQPTSVWTGMVNNDYMFRIFRPDLDNPTIDDIKPTFAGLNLLPVPWVQPEDVSNAVLFLASEESRYITGVALPVDAGSMQKAPGLPWDTHATSGAHQ